MLCTDACLSCCQCWRSVKVSDWQIESVCSSRRLSVCVCLCRISSRGEGRVDVVMLDLVCLSASLRASFVIFDKCFVKSSQLYKEHTPSPGRAGVSVLRSGFVLMVILTVCVCSQRPDQRLQHQRRRPEDLRGLREVVAVDRSVSPDLLCHSDVHVLIQSVMLRETLKHSTRDAPIADYSESYLLITITIVWAFCLL